MTRRPFLALAQRFLIRRYGESINWNCTYAEIGAATGIHPTTVSKICRRYGYRINVDPRLNGDRLFGDPVPVDAYFAAQHTELS